MTVPGAAPSGGNNANTALLLSLYYDQRKSQQQIAKMTADLQKAQQKIATAQQQATAKMAKQQQAQFAADVERFRKQIQATLDATTRKPREQGDILKIAGLNAGQIKAAQVELARAGSSVSSMERALRRVRVPAAEARAMAMAMKEAANEAQALQGELNQTFFRFRRISEQGVRLSEVGFILGASGAAILAPLTLAATQYTERFRSLEEEAARFTAVQNEQKEAISDLGREASVALMPVMEALLNVLKEITRVVKENPGLLQAAVLGGAGLAGVGTAMVLFGRIESVIGRMGALFFSNMPGSINIPALLGLGGGATTTAKGQVGLTGLGGAVLRGGIFAGAIAAGAELASQLLVAGQHLGWWSDKLDSTGDGIVDFQDAMQSLRSGLATVFMAVVDGFYRVVSALVTFVEWVGTLPERALNFIRGNGFVTSETVQQQAGIRAQIEDVEKRRRGVEDVLDTASLTRGDLAGQKDYLTRLYAQGLQELARRQDLVDKSAGDPVMQALLKEERRVWEQYLLGLRDDIQRTEEAIRVQEADPQERERLLAELANLDTTLLELNRQLEEAGGQGAPSELVQSIEAQRQHILDELAGKMVEWVETGTTTGGGGGGGTAHGTGPGGAPAGPTPEELALFGAYRQAELAAERQYQQALTDLNRQRRLQELQAEREHQRNLAQMEREQARRERDMLEDHAIDQQQAQIEFARKEADIERKRQFDRLQKLREHELRLTELAAARDVGGFVEAQKRFALEQRQEEKQADFDRKQRQKEFDTERADKEREFQHQLMQQRRAYEEQRADALRNHETQKAERQRQYDEQLQQMRTEQDRQRQERLRDFAQQLDDLRVSQGILTAERKAYNDAVLAGYKELLSGHSAALAQALQQAYGIAPRAVNYQTPLATSNRSVTIPSSTLRLTRYDTGSRNIPRDQIAHLSAGERVLTTAQNRAYGPMLDQMDRGMWPTGGRTVILNITGNAFGRTATLDDVHEMGMEIVRGMEESGAML